MAQTGAVTGAAKRAGAKNGALARARPRPKRSSWPLRLALFGFFGIALAAGAAHVLAERFWWSTLLLYLPQVIYLAPLPLLFFIALARRDGRSLLVNLLTTALVLGPIMGFQYHPHRTGAAEAAQNSGARRVRVLEYNIHGGTAGAEKIAAEVQHYRPDVVVFAEADGWSRGEQLRADLRRIFPGWHAVRGAETWVASRWPLQAADVEPLGTGAAKDSNVDRRKVRLVVRAPFGTFNVVGVHFYTALHGHTLLNQRRHLPAYMEETAGIRLDQARDLAVWAASLPGPTLVAGDFNTPPGGVIYREMTRPFTDSFAEAGTGWGHTYPSRWKPPSFLGDLPALPVSFLRIDYVFHSRHWKALQCEVGGRDGSDHRPLLAELELTSVQDRGRSPAGLPARTPAEVRPAIRRPARAELRQADLGIFRAERQALRADAR
jgi:endonuclease/exonuclease/phosphatase (EEP) superfamily protein YafD